MSRSAYEELMHAEFARLAVRPTDADSSRDTRPSFYPLVLNLLSLSIVLVLPVFYLEQLDALPIMMGVLAMSLVMGSWPILARLASMLGGAGTPRVVAVLKAPDRLFCPRCGAEKTSEYCSGCGAHVETEYRKITRQLVRFVVEDSERQRTALEAELLRQLREVALEHRRALDEALRTMERTYIDEIERQRKAIVELRRGGQAV